MTDHNDQDLPKGIEPADFNARIAALKHEINLKGDKKDITLEEQLALIDQLADIELGRYLIMNRGLNGYWTHYILSYPHGDGLTDLHQPKNALERTLLNQLPLIQAMRQRYRYFLEQIQLRVKEGHK